MENLDASIQGLIIGLSTFLIIGLFHPLVIKGEYYFGLKIRWAFLVCGLAALACTFLCTTILWAGLLAVVAFSCFWSVKEVTDQRKRVERGWFPKNPKRSADYADKNLQTSGNTQRSA